MRLLKVSGPILTGSTLLVLNLLRSVGCLNGPSLEGIESFIDAMRRLDVEDIPCAVIDTACLSNPRHLVLLHLRQHPFEHLFATNFVERFSSVKRWLESLRLRDKIWESMTDTQKEMLGLVFKSADRASKTRQQDVRKPFQFVNFILDGAVEEAVLKEIPVERLVFVLQFKEDFIATLPGSVSQPGFVPQLDSVDFLAPFLKSSDQCSPTPRWIDELAEIGGKEGLVKVRERLCFYQKSVLDFVQNTTSKSDDRLERALQPFLAYNPLLAFASHHLARVYRTAIQIDGPAHRKVLENLETISAFTSLNVLTDQYGDYVMSARTRLAEFEWVRLCTGFDRYLARLFTSVKGLTASLSSLSDCRMVSFGMDGGMEFNDRVHLISAFLKEPFRGSYSKETEAALIVLGKNEPAKALQNLDGKLAIKLKLLFRIKDMGRHLLNAEGEQRSNLELLNGMTRSVASATFLVEDEEAERILSRIIDCNLQDADELRLFFLAVANQSSTMYCSSPLDRPVFINVEALGGNLEAYHSLSNHLLGFPLAFPTNISSIEAKKRIFALAKKVDLQDRSLIDLISMAILTAGKAPYNKMNSLWKEPEAVKEFYGELRQAACHNIPDDKEISLEMFWPHFLPANLEKLRCLASDGTPNHPRIVERILSKLPFVPSDSDELKKKLKTLPMLYLYAIEAAITEAIKDERLPDWSKIIQNPLLCQLITLPLYGPFVLRMLRDTYWSTRLISLQLGADREHWLAFVALLEEYFRELQIYDRVSMLPEIVPGFLEYVAKNSQVQTKSFTELVTNSVIYGIPVVRWIRDKKAFEDHLFSGISPPAKVDQEVLFRAVVMEGFGKKWADIYTDREFLIKTAITEKLDVKD